MKTQLTTLFIIFLVTASYAQDLIITNENDSISCKINKIEPEYFLITNSPEKKIRYTIIPKKKVKRYRKSYFEMVKLQKELESWNNIVYKKTRFSFNVGYSYRLGKAANVPPMLQNHIRKLKHGYHFGADFAYFMSPSFGAGAKYHFFKTSHTSKEIHIYAEDTTIRGNVSNDISIFFIGPSVTFKYPYAKEKNNFYSSIAVGFMKYKDHFNFANAGLKITGDSVGFSFDVAYDLTLSDAMILGLRLSLISGRLTAVDYGGTTKELSDEEYESLNRIDFSVGLRFGK